MQPWALDRLAEALRQDGRMLLSMAEEVDHAARTARKQHRVPRGFQLIGDWDGTGVMRDRRWRGGRPHRLSGDQSSTGRPVPAEILAGLKRRS